MKIKVSETSKIQLDWLVATCWWYDEFDRTRIWLKNGQTRILNNPTEFPESWMYSVEWSPTTNWSQGGTLIEKERIRLEPLPDKGWRAYLPVKQGLWVDAWGDRATPLRVAMECFVASKLGDAVEVPDELGEQP